MITMVAGDPIIGKNRLHVVPELQLDDGRMLARIGLPLVNDFAPVEAVRQHQVERAPCEGLCTIRAAVG
ncbi:MAG: hypothetical protein K0S56_2402 [Microvirga sp.]|nr:hypothetical protein [Microvirga sp.]